MWVNVELKYDSTVYVDRFSTRSLQIRWQKTTQRSTQEALYVLETYSVEYMMYIRM